jgi:hypothetical protein
MKLVNYVRFVFETHPTITGGAVTLLEVELKASHHRSQPDYFILLCPHIDFLGQVEPSGIAWAARFSNLTPFPRRVATAYTEWLCNALFVSQKSKHVLAPEQMILGFLLSLSSWPPKQRDRQTDCVLYSESPTQKLPVHTTPEVRSCLCTVS